ncbi:hypothetical protein HPB49_001690 [Dermacentor silvarum]|uniref:Uncharacterized protein n=1 Tax=Dermacentor silvarum TaxID=543639 RepID=A0ACB8CJ98_DERSI|nr:hypothetical protein HPB49_001690 [Dermacentor silvarum]
MTDGSLKKYMFESCSTVISVTLMGDVVAEDVRRVESYFEGNDIVDDAKKRALLISALGSKPIDVLNGRCAPRREDPTLLAIVPGKLRGVAADWHASTGRQLTTLTIWKAVLQEQFGEQLSMIQRQQKVTALTQKAGESLQQYTFAKFKIMSRCPVPITDKECIEYLVQGIRDDQVVTSIAVQRPRTVDDFLSIIPEVEGALDHARLIDPLHSQQSNSQDSRDAPSSRVLLRELTVL